ncbi:MAG: glutaredoxin family protein [Candidatus Sericytochromatia bacterium]|nr:glutaredoxin family protein [Candidatus Sericytochromatia bacterium]
MTRLTLYTKPGCCLCDKAEPLIERVRQDVPFEFERVDITQDELAAQAYAHRIPVVTLDDDVVLAGKISEFWLRRVLAGERNPRLVSA